MLCFHLNNNIHLYQRYTIVFVSMIPEGPNVKNQSNDPLSQGTLSLSQHLLKLQQPFSEL